MKAIRLILCVFLGSLLQSQAQGHAVKMRLKAIVKEFQALPEQAQEEYNTLKKKAFEASQQKKYFSCLVAINDAQNIFRKDMDVLFLNGICRAEIHDVDKALEYYDEVLAINPNHAYTLMNVVEINFFAGRYKETIKHINRINVLINNRGNGKHDPLLQFKLLISLTKLAKENPDLYTKQLKKVRTQYSFMDDTPFYYYANALKAFDTGDKQEGLIWILKAYLIFGNPQLIETWNKALVDTDYIGAHEIMFNRREEKE